MPNDERCRPLWVSTTLPVFRNLAAKRCIVLPSGTLFLPKSLLHCRCVRKTDFVVKYDDFYPLLCSIASSWIQIGVKRISQACCLHHLKNMENNWKTQHWYEKQNRALFMDHTVVPNLTIFLKLPLSSRHHSITDKFFKTRSCPLFRGFTV